MPPAPKRSAGQAAIKMAASLAKMSQKPNTHAAEPAEEPLPKKTRFAPPASWLGNHEQNDYAEQNGESEQNADAAPSSLKFPANATGTNNATRAAEQHAEEPPQKKAKFAHEETNQPAPAGAAESKPQEACNK